MRWAEGVAMTPSVGPIGTRGARVGACQKREGRLRARPGTCAPDQSQRGKKPLPSLSSVSRKKVAL